MWQSDCQLFNAFLTHLEGQTAGMCQTQCNNCVLLDFQQTFSQFRLHLAAVYVDVVVCEDPARTTQQNCRRRQMRTTQMAADGTEDNCSLPLGIDLIDFDLDRNSIDFAVIFWQISHHHFPSYLHLCIGLCTVDATRTQSLD